MAKKRRARESRKPKKVEPPRWLICCEGKSEVVYLRDLIEDIAKGRKHNIEIGIGGECASGRLCGECGRQHMKLVHKVQQCANKHGPYQKIWIVFDMDKQGKDADKLSENFRNAVKYVEDAGYLDAAWSVPSFEYWLVLHSNNYLDCGIEETIKEKLKDLIRSGYQGKKLHCNKKYQNRAGEKHCRAPNPCICSKVEEKPYYNGYKVLGELEGVRKAIIHSKRCYKENQKNIKRNNFDKVSCCSAMHLLVEAIMQYFENV